MLIQASVVYLCQMDSAIHSGVVNMLRVSQVSPQPQKVFVLPSLQNCQCCVAEQPANETPPENNLFLFLFVLLNPVRTVYEYTCTI